MFGGVILEILERITPKLGLPTLWVLYCVPAIFRYILEFAKKSTGVGEPARSEPDGRQASTLGVLKLRPGRKQYYGDKTFVEKAKAFEACGVFG